jgi:hypothetical protein
MKPQLHSIIRHFFPLSLYSFGSVPLSAEDQK